MNRSLRLVAPAAAAIITLAGCTLTNKQGTSQTYTPADGMNLNITDDVGIRNALVVTDGDEHTMGALIATVVNDSPKDETVWIKGEGFSANVDVEAGQAVRISPVKTANGEEALHVTINELSAVPGELLDVQSGLTSQPTQGKQWGIPVLAPDLPRYQTLTPTSSSSAQDKATATATADTTDDPSATATQTADSQTSSTASPSATATEPADNEGAGEATATATATQTSSGDQ